jgi:hypothetical protein
VTDWAFTSVDGVIGLSLDSFGGGYPLLRTWYSQGLVSAPTFGFLFDTQPATSYLDIGALHPESVKTGTVIKWMGTIDKGLWAQNVEGIAVGSD